MLRWGAGPDWAAAAADRLPSTILSALDRMGRNIMHFSSAAVILLIASCMLHGQAGAREVLRVLAWPGYADQDWVLAFSKRYDVDVEVSLVSSDDELWARMNANKGRNFDVFAANTAEMVRYIDAGLSVPLRLKNIPNTRNQVSRFQPLTRIPGISRGGSVYAVPFTYSEMGLIYNRKLVKQPPTSMLAMWDPQYKGKVLAYDGSSHNFSLTALTLGIRNPFKLDDTAFARTLQRLRELRRNLHGLYSRPEEAVDLFREHQIALMFGNYGTQQVQLLRKAGQDVGYVIPREGALAWLDCWATTVGAKNRAIAEAWINFTLEPAVSGQLPARQGLANTIEASSSGSTTDGDKLIWLQPVENYDKRTLFWERIRSGYQKRKF